MKTLTLEQKIAAVAHLDEVGSMVVREAGITLDYIKREKARHEEALESIEEKFDRLVWEGVTADWSQKEINKAVKRSSETA